MVTLTADRFRSFEEEGYLNLGCVMSAETLEGLRERITDLMLGRVRYRGMFFQLDETAGEHGSSAGSGDAFAGPSLAYRKIKDLEFDDRFLAFMQNDVFRALAERYVGPSVASMRAMLFNKPAHSGSVLQYHQDVSEKWQMTEPPVLTIWTALDDATRDNGCLELVPGSHRHGAIGAGHMLTPEDEAKFAPPGSSRFIELEAGEAVVFHNALLHRSGANHTDCARRAFTLCLMSGSARHARTGRPYPLIFGPQALTVAEVRGLDAVPPHVYD
jgi:phytanoyl-CoA hydroxylase